MTATLQRLHIDVSQFGVAGQHVPNIHAAAQCGYPEFAPAVVSHDGTLVLVGSGPSLPTVIEEIRAERVKGRPLLAINGAHDFLYEHDLPPDLFLTVDPRDLRHNLKHKDRYTLYLLASRCAPEVFEHLKDQRIMLWHSWGKGEEVDAVKSITKYAIGGGSTSGLRAIMVGYMMGFRNFILFGYDSCNAPDGTKRFDGSQTGVTRDVICGDRTFSCNMAMAAQANEFQLCTYGLMPDIHIEARGDGLIAAILAERARLGRRV